MPFSFQIVVVACQPDLKRFSCRASSIIAVLMRSDGVTAVADAAIPAVMPANKFRTGDSEPVSGSAKASFIWSKKRNRTPSLPIEPCDTRWPCSQRSWFKGPTRDQVPPTTATTAANRESNLTKMPKDKRENDSQELEAHSLCTQPGYRLFGRPAERHKMDYVVSVRPSLASIALLSSRIQEDTWLAVSHAISFSIGFVAAHRYESFYTTSNSTRGERNYCWCVRILHKVSKFERDDGRAHPHWRLKPLKPALR
jgi:hypothetical protein